MTSISGQLIGILLSIVNGVTAWSCSGGGGSVVFKLVSPQILGDMKHQCLSGTTERLMVDGVVTGRMRPVIVGNVRFINSNIEQNITLNKDPQLSAYHLRRRTMGVEIPCVVADVTFSFSTRVLRGRYRESSQDVTVEFVSTPVALRVAVRQWRDGSCSLRLSKRMYKDVLRGHKVLFRYSAGCEDTPSRRIFSTIRRSKLRRRLYRQYKAQIVIFAYYILQESIDQRNKVVFANNQLNRFCSSIQLPWYRGNRKDDWDNDEDDYSTGDGGDYSTEDGDDYSTEYGDEYGGDYSTKDGDDYLTEYGDEYGGDYSTEDWDEYGGGYWDNNVGWYGKADANGYRECP